MTSGKRPRRELGLAGPDQEAIKASLSLGQSDFAVARQLSRLLLPPPVVLQAAILLIRDDLLDRLSRLPTSVGGIRTVESDGGAAVLEIKWHVEELRGHRTLFRIAPRPGGAIAVLITAATDRVWRIGFKRVLSWLYPSAFPPFLRQPHLSQVFGSLRKELGRSRVIRLTRVSSLRRLLHSHSRRRYESGLTWTDLDAGQAFQAAAESNTYFRSISFELCDDSDGEHLGTGIKGRISRDGRFASTGEFEWLFGAGVESAIGMVRKDYEIVRNRGRMRVVGPRPRAIVARFADVPLRRKDIPQIAGRLRAMPRASVSILHSNPYLSATVVDMRDGSTFDVLVASEQDLLIVPQLRATEAAVTRMCRYLYDQLGEAEFLDADRASSAS